MVLLHENYDPAFTVDKRDMASNQVALIAKITATPGNRDKVSSSVGQIDANCKLLEIIQTQIEYVRANESATLSYYFMVPQKDDPDLIIVFELYENEAAVKKHATSDGMKALIKAGSERKLQASMDLIFLSPAIGFVSRPNSDKKVTFNLLAEITFREGTRDEGIRKSTPVAEDVEKNEHGTPSYLMMKDTKDANKLFVFEGYESEKSILRRPCKESSREQEPN